MQVWSHSGKHHLCFFCWDNQSGSYPPGRHFPRRWWPDCPSSARDPRAGPNVSDSPGKEMPEEPRPGTFSAPHFLSVTVQRTLDSTGRNVDFVTPSLGPISAVKMFVTQVTDLGCPEPPR